MSDHVSLAEALDQLAFLDEMQVASLMALSGVTGDRGDAEHCPLSHYLHKVTGKRVMVTRVLVYDMDAGEKKLLPVGAVHFIHAFDGGFHKNLERTCMPPSKPTGTQEVFIP